jgi:hypothetical protein
VFQVTLASRACIAASPCAGMQMLGSSLPEQFPEGLAGKADRNWRMAAAVES